MKIKYYISIIATILTVILYFPQIIYILKHKKTNDLSMGYLFISLINHIVWLLYAIFDNINIPLIICDTLCIILVIFIMLLKLYYDKKNAQVILN